jgi:hypothetical protein
MKPKSQNVGNTEILQRHPLQGKFKLKSPTAIMYAEGEELL